MAILAISNTPTTSTISIIPVTPTAKTKAPKASKAPTTPTAKPETKAPEAPAKVEVKVPEVKVEKKDIDIANLPAIKSITVTTKSSCIIFQNENGVRWYLKGHTMEVTSAKGLESRTELLSQERLDSGRMGKIIGMIRKVKDNNDLTSILSHLITTTAKKVEKSITTPITIPTPTTTKAA